MLASQFLLKYLSLTAARWLHNSMLKQLLRSVPHSCAVSSSPKLAVNNIMGGDEMWDSSPSL